MAGAINEKKGDTCAMCGGSGIGGSEGKPCGACGRSGKEQVRINKDRLLKYGLAETRIANFVHVSERSIGSGPEKQPQLNWAKPTLLGDIVPGDQGHLGSAFIEVLTDTRAWLCY